MHYLKYPMQPDDNIDTRFTIASKYIKKPRNWK